MQLQNSKSLAYEFLHPSGFEYFIGLMDIYKPKQEKHHRQAHPLIYNYPHFLENILPAPVKLAELSQGIELRLLTVNGRHLEPVNGEDIQKLLTHGYIAEHTELQFGDLGQGRDVHSVFQLLDVQAGAH